MKNNKTKFRDDSDVMDIREIKTTNINILKAPVENRDNMYKQMDMLAER